MLIIFFPEVSVVFECPCGGSTECFIFTAFFKCAASISSLNTVHSVWSCSVWVVKLFSLRSVCCLKCPAGLYTGSMICIWDVRGHTDTSCLHSLVCVQTLIQQTRELVHSPLKDPRDFPLSVKLILNSSEYK